MSTSHASPSVPAPQSLICSRKTWLLGGGKVRRHTSGGQRDRCPLFGRRALISVLRAVEARADHPQLEAELFGTTWLHNAQTVGVGGCVSPALEEYVSEFLKPVTYPEVFASADFRTKGGLPRLPDMLCRIAVPPSGSAEHLPYRSPRDGDRPANAPGAAQVS